LEIDPHDDLEVFLQPLTDLDQALRVLERGLGVVDRAGAHDDQQPVVHRMQDPVGRLPGSEGRGRRPIADRVLAKQVGGRRELLDLADPDIIGGDGHDGPWLSDWLMKYSVGIFGFGLRAAAQKKTAGIAGGLHRIRFSVAVYERAPDSSRRWRKKPKK